MIIKGESLYERSQELLHKLGYLPLEGSEKEAFDSVAESAPPYKKGGARKSPYNPAIFVPHIEREYVMSLVRLQAISEDAPNKPWLTAMAQQLGERAQLMWQYLELFR